MYVNKTYMLCKHSMLDDFYYVVQPRMMCKQHMLDELYRIDIAECINVVQT